MSASAAGLVLAVSVGLGSCRESAPAAPAATELVVAFQSPPDTLDPLLHKSARATTLWTTLLSLSLLTVGPDGELRPWLAQRLPIVSGTRHEWELRPQARWPGGPTVTSGDVQATFGRARELGARLGRMSEALRGVERLEVLSPTRFAVHLRDPEAGAAERFGRLFIVQPRDGAAGGDHRGCGPYRLTSHDSGETVLERNVPWWGDEVNDLSGLFQPRRWVQRYIRDGDATLRLLENGDVDVCGLGAERAATAKPPIRVRDYYLRDFSYVGWNLERPPFDDARVRRALSRLVPRRKLAEGVFRGQVRPIDAPFGETSGDGLALDVVEARSQLADAGFADSDDDGRLDRSGKPLEIDLVVPQGNVPWIEHVGSAWRELLAQLGIRLRTRPLDMQALLGALRAGEFDAFLLVWRVRSTRPTFHGLLHSSQAGAGGLNFSRFRSPDTDRLLDELARATDGERRDELEREIDEIVVRERPITCLFRHATHLAWRGDRVDVVVGPYGIFWPATSRR